MQVNSSTGAKSFLDKLSRLTVRMKQVDAYRPIRDVDLEVLASDCGQVPRPNLLAQKIVNAQPLMPLCLDMQSGLAWIRVEPDGCVESLGLHINRETNGGSDRLKYA